MASARSVPLVRRAMGFALLHESQVVIAENTKDVPNPNFLQAAKQKIANRLFDNGCLLQVVCELLRYLLARSSVSPSP